MKHCVEMNTQTNLLIDTNLSVDCGTLRIIEFDMKLLDGSKKPTLWTRAANTTLVEDSSWFNIDWTASTV